METISFEKLDSILQISSFFFNGKNTPEVLKILLELATTIRYYESEGKNKALNRLMKYFKNENLDIITLRFRFNNEILEVIGDTVLNLIAINYMFKIGVNDISLFFQITQNVSLFYFSKHFGNDLCPFEDFDKKCADLLEAIIGALYVYFGDFKLVYDWFFKTFEDIIESQMLYHTGGIPYPPPCNTKDIKKISIYPANQEQILDQIFLLSWNQGGPFNPEILKNKNLIDILNSFPDSIVIDNKTINRDIIIKAVAPSISKFAILNNMYEIANFSRYPHDKLNALLKLKPITLHEIFLDFDTILYCKVSKSLDISNNSSLTLKYFIGTIYLYFSFYPKMVGNWIISLSKAYENPQPLKV